MPYQDLVALDEKTELHTLPKRQAKFELKETEDGNRLFVNFGDVEVQAKKTYRQFEILCGAFGVPYKFAENVSQNLLKEIFTEVAYGASSDSITNWLIDTDEDELISLGDARKPYVPYSSVGEILQSKGLELDGNLIRHGQAEITGTHPTSYTVEPRAGDTIRSGVNIRLNSTMDTPPQVVPWSLRLVCTNGMTSFRERETVNVTGHTVEDVLEQIEFQAQKAMEFAERINHGFSDMVGHRVDNPAEAMRNVLLSRNIPARMRQNLIDEASSLATDRWTMYDILNIYTRQATGIYDSDSRLKLQSIGGELALDNHLHCGRCGSELN